MKASDTAASALDAAVRTIDVPLPPSGGMEPASLRLRSDHHPDGL